MVAGLGLDLDPNRQVGQLVARIERWAWFGLGIGIWLGWKLGLGIEITVRVEHASG